MLEVVRLLIEQNKTISAMESCTGGSFANAITNIDGASNVLKFSAVTYSNEYKIKMGVPASIIDKYSVYSIETAISMSRAISSFTDSDYGVGITGKINKPDLKNPYGLDNTIFISIYDKYNDINYNFQLTAIKENREENKQYIINYITSKFLEIIKKKNQRLSKN